MFRNNPNKMKSGYSLFGLTTGMIYGYGIRRHDKQQIESFNQNLKLAKYWIRHKQSEEQFHACFLDKQNLSNDQKSQANDVEKSSTELFRKKWSSRIVGFACAHYRHSPNAQRILEMKFMEPLSELEKWPLKLFSKRPGDEQKKSDKEILYDFIDNKLTMNDPKRRTGMGLQFKL